MMPIAFKFISNIIYKAYLSLEKLESSGNEVYF